MAVAPNKHKRPRQNHIANTIKRQTQKTIAKNDTGRYLKHTALKTHIQGTHNDIHRDMYRARDGNQKIQKSAKNAEQTDSQTKLGEYQSPEQDRNKEKIQKQTHR